MGESKILVQMNNIRKYYPGVQALDNVNFTLREGEIHSLCGENGAGKSTLIKILTGAEQPDEGQILLEGKCISPKTPLDARNLGIGTVYQEVNLCGNLSVAENIYLGRQPKTRLNTIDWSKMEKLANIAMSRLNLKIDVTARLDEYSVAIQQMVAIASALDLNAKVLVLDEPTSSLDSKEVAQLFNVMRNLKKQGIGIIFISHFFDQIFDVSDRVTVLRNVKLIDSLPIEELTRKMLVEKMLGKELAEQNYEYHKAHRSEKTDVMYNADDLGKRGIIGPLSNIKLEKGRVTSFAGLLGSGRSETAKLIFAIDKPETGEVTIERKKINIFSPHDAVRNSMGFCPENRKTEGIITSLSIRENIILSLQGKRGMWKPLSKEEQYKIADKYIKALNIKTPSADQLVGNLSGGNQQKVLVAKWLATDPNILLLDEPTRGIDVGAKAEIMKLIVDLADEGKAVLFISSEISEITHCADKVYVFRDKQIVDVLENEKITEDNIFNAIAESDIEFTKVECKL